MTPTSNSDSEDDLDYVPSADDDDSGSSSDERGDIERSAETASRPEDLSEQKKQRDELWASFQASVSPSTDINASTDVSASSSTVGQVQIEKTYLFAGKYVTEVVQVPEDSEEAKEWPRWSPPVKTDAQAQGEGVRDRELIPPSPADDARSASTSTTATATTSSVASSASVTRPGPRKPRTALPSIPKASQAKKITTLDKSAMDWRSHVASQSGDFQDDLNANRRGGGFLEKMEFLRRVEDRRGDALEASKSNKRRKT